MPNGKKYDFSDFDTPGDTAEGGKKYDFSDFDAPIDVLTPPIVLQPAKPAGIDKTPEQLGFDFAETGTVGLSAISKPLTEEEKTDFKPLDHYINAEIEKKQADHTVVAASITPEQIQKADALLFEQKRVRLPISEEEKLAEIRPYEEGREAAMPGLEELRKKEKEEKGEGSYFLGTVRAVNEGTAGFFRDLDGAASVLSDVTGVGKSGLFENMAEYIETSAAKLPETPNTPIGNALQDVGHLEGLFLELVLTPEFRSARLAQMTKGAIKALPTNIAERITLGDTFVIPKIVTQLGVSGFAGTYGAMHKTDATGTEKTVESFKAMGYGIKDGILLSFLGYGAGKASAAVKKATDSGLATWGTGLGVNAGGFGGLTAVESLITSGNINWEETRRAAVLGGALALPGLPNALLNRAFGNFFTASPVAIKMAKDIKKTPEELRDISTELREKASTIADKQEKEKNLVQADFLDNTTDIKVISEDILSNQEKYIEAVHGNMELSEIEKTTIVKKINKFISEQDPDLQKNKPFFDELKRLKAKKDAIEKNEYLPEEAKKHKVEDIDLQIEKVSGQMKMPEKISEPPITEPPKEPEKPSKAEPTEKKETESLKNIENTTKALEELTKINPDIKERIGKTLGENVYHGTDIEFESFDVEKIKKWGKFGLWFANDKPSVEVFGKNIRTVIVDLKNPKIITAEKWNNIRDAHAKDEKWFKTWKQKLISQGYDGLKIEGGKEVFAGQEMIIPTTYAAFKNEQVREITTKNISKEYHKAKTEGSNPELVKAVEEAISKKSEKPSEKITPPTEPEKKDLPEFKEHITTGTKEQKGKYQIEKVGDEVKILNVDSGKYVKPTKQNQWVIDQYVDANIENLRSGKEAEIPEGINPDRIYDFITENSKNPAEIATAWIGSKETKDVGTITFEEAVYEVARDIDPVDFAKTVGFGPKDVPHLLNRFKKGGVSLDVIRERVAEQLELSEEQAEYFEKQPTKEAEPIQRIVDLLTSPKFKDYKPKKETITEINLAEKFKELTGLDLTFEAAKKVTDYRDKLEKWADKIDEFIEEIPEVGLPFFMAPRLLKFALQTVSKALRAGSDLSRAIKLAIIKTKEIMKADEKFDEKEFRKLIREKGQAAMLGMKERKFAKRIEAAKGLSEEIRKGLSDEGKYYVPITNRITKEEAQIIINEKGVDLALSDVINENNVLSPAVRITLGETLIHEYNKLAIEGKDVKKQYAKAVEVAEFLTQYGTKLGQGIQAFHIWSELSPESVILKIKKDLKKQDIELTPEQEKEIRKLTEKVEKAEEGLSKSRAIQDLLAYQMKIEGVNWGDVAMSVWYSHILSGYRTQQLNFGANMMQTTGELYTSILYNPKATPFLLKGLYEGYGRGLFEAWGTLKTGYTPINQIKFETGKAGTPSVLEVIKFKGGQWNPLNYYKYVQRFMMATDAFSFYGLKEMRDYELAHREAKKFEEPDKTTWDKVNQLLYKDQITKAKKQAGKEGLSGTEYKQRVYEIMEQKRAVELTEDSNNFAAHGTFNYKLEGSLGLLTSRVAEAIEAINYKGIKPLKFVVPFTRIISNVTNEYLDWSVWGYVRAARGERGLLTGGSKRFTRELTKEERIKNIIKATTGTAAMLTIYALTDEDDGTFEITANGTGDYKKNYELKEQGWQPYSIRIGKKWYSYINTPLAIPFAFIGNIRDNAKYKDNFLDGEDVLTKTLITAYNTSKFVTDMTFLRGFSEFVGSFSEKNPELAASYFERFGTQVIKGFVVPNIATQVSRKIQETFEMPIKQADNLWEQIIRDMPIARKGLKDVINTLGDPVIPNTDRWVRDAEFDPIWDVIIKNNAWIGKVNKGTISIYDPEKDMMRPVTDDEYYDFSKLRGQLIKQAITTNLSKLQTMDKEAVKNTITVYKSRATIDAKDKLFAPKSKKAKSIYGSPNSGYYQDE